MGALTALVGDTNVNVGIGGSGAPSVITKNAAYSLIAYKVLTTDAAGLAIYADAATLSHVGKVLGLGQNAAAPAGSVNIQDSGLITNTGWAWTVGALLYVGLAGEIVETQVGLFSLCIGYALSPTEISLNIQQGIIRS